MGILFSFLCVAILIGIGELVRRKLRGEPLIQEDPRKKYLELQDFKQRARKVAVQFQDCKVLSNSFVQDDLKSQNWRVQALDSLSGDGMANVRQVNVQQSQLVYRITEGLTHYDYVSSVVYMERTTLLMKMEINKQTTLYIDENDRSKYYFDLEFL